MADFLSGATFKRRAGHFNKTASRIGLLMLTLGGFATENAIAESVWVGQFQTANGALPSPWKIEQLDSTVAATRYQTRVWDGVPAVEAAARNSMSVLVRPVAADLAATPFFCWRWRVDASVGSADIRTKAGDDYAARVYLMFRVDEQHLTLGTRAKLALARAVRGNSVPDAAINYVWDNRNPIGTRVPNAYTDRAMMWVLRSGDIEAGRWVTERRDVRNDFERAFGYLPHSLYAIGLATDTDNTGGAAKAGFAELRFVAENDHCGQQ